VTIRVGIVGSDNTHALGFAHLINVQQSDDHELQVVAITGDDASQTRTVAEQGGIAAVVDSVDAMVGMVDAAIVVNRHGSVHLANARPFVAAGLPVLVDKPFATEVAAAMEFLAFARERGSLVTSYSSLRWCKEVEDLKLATAALDGVVLGVFGGPCDFDSQYDGVFFYGVHTVEMATTVMAADPVRVRVTRVGAGRTVVVELADGARQVLNLDPGLQTFSGQVVSRDDIVMSRVSSSPDLVASLEAFLTMIRTGAAPLSARQLLGPVATLSAIAESDRTGDWVAVARPEVP